MRKRKGAGAPSPSGSALAGSGRVGKKSLEDLGFSPPLGVALGHESGQLRLDFAALVFREKASCKLSAQFVDMIDDAHVRRLRLDDVDAARAPEDRVKDRNATGEAGEGRSRFCRSARQNWRSRSSLRRAEQPYPQTSLREENRVPKGDASVCLRRPGQQRRGSPARRATDPCDRQVRE